MQEMVQYQQWSEQELNQRIFALYDQIQKVTLQNLEVAQQNCQLQVQIKTIDDIVESHPFRQNQRTISTNRSEESVQSKYQTLLDDHLKLKDRVNQMEQLLYQGHRKRTNIAKSLRGSLNKTPSLQGIPIHTHRNTASKFQNRIQQSETTSRYGESHRKSHFK